MSSAALLRIRNLLKEEEDLNKLAQLRHQIVREKTAIDLKLATTSQLQIELVMENVEQLSIADRAVVRVKQNIQAISGALDDQAANAQDHLLIRLVAGALQYMLRTHNLYQDITRYKGWLEHLNGEIEAELEAMQSDLSYSLPRLYPLHHQVTQARNIADYLLVYSTNLLDDTQLIVTRIVAPLNKTVHAFELLLTEIISSVTEASKEGNEGLVLKLCQIIVYEQQEDAKTALLKNLGIASSRDATTVDYTQFRSAPRLYLKFFYDRMEMCLDELFQACVSNFEDDPIQVYDNLDWLESELSYVTLELATCFPENWEIGDFFRSVYHDRLHKFTIDMINSDPPADALMQILTYDSHYAQFLAGLKKGSGKSIIGDDLKDVVLQDYLRMIVAKMNEWNTNLIAQELEAFVTRKEPGRITHTSFVEDYDQNDQIIVVEQQLDIYVLPDCATPLKMLKEQADVAAELGYSKILVSVIENWLRLHLERLENYLSIITIEHEKYMLVYSNEKCLLKESKRDRLLRRKQNQAPEIDLEGLLPQELAEISRPGLVEYLAALCNTLEVNNERLQGKMLENYKVKVHANYYERLDTAFSSTVEPTYDLVSQVVDILCDIMLNDMYPALLKVFTKEWYDDPHAPENDASVALLLVEAITDYMADFCEYAAYDVYMLIFRRFFDQFVANYLRIGYENILYGSGKKIDPHPSKGKRNFAQAASRDAEVLFGGLEHLLNRKDAAWLLNCCRVVEFLSTLATVDVPEISQVWEREILPCYHDCLVEYVRGVLLCRKDVDTKRTDIIITELRHLQTTYQNMSDAPQPPLGEMARFSFALK